MANTKTINTTCSGCMADVQVHTLRSVVSSVVPSNGQRGAGHVPAHTVEAEAWVDDEGMILWDCPVCGHADSYHAESAV